MADPTPDSPPATIVVSRTDPTDAGHRQILVRLDRGPTISLMHGETTTMTAAPGEHTLHANNTLFWKNTPFEAHAGERIEFQITNVAGALSFGFLAGLGLAPMYLRVKKL